jgi:hypothetical protein
VAARTDPVRRVARPRHLVLGRTVLRALLDRTVARAAGRRALAHTVLLGQQVRRVAPPSVARQVPVLPPRPHPVRVLLMRLQALRAHL